MKTLASFKREVVGRVAKIVKDEMSYPTEQRRVVNGAVVNVLPNTWIDFSASHRFLNTPREIIASNSMGIQFLQPDHRRGYLSVRKASEYKPTDNGFIIETDDDGYKHRLTYEFVGK